MSESVASSYRAAQRALRVYVSNSAKWSRWMGSQWRAGVGLESEQEQAQQEALSAAATRMMSALVEHRELLRRYNVGMEYQRDSKEHIEASAARVGLSLPASKPIE